MKRTIIAILSFLVGLAAIVARGATVSDRGQVVCGALTVSGPCVVESASYAVSADGLTITVQPPAIITEINAGDGTTPDDTGPSTPPSPATSTAMQAAVKPVRVLLTGNPNAAKLADMFGAMRVMVRTIDLPTTADVARWQKNYVTRWAEMSNWEQISGLSAELDKVAKAVLGEAAVAVDKAKLDEMYRGLEWAAREAGK